MMGREDPETPVGHQASAEFAVLGEPIAARSKQTPAYREWVEQVRRAAGDRVLPANLYHVRMEFVIPTERLQKGDFQNPYGKDLDNLIMPVFDGLSRSLLRGAGGDGAIWRLTASKRGAAPSEQCGVMVSISPLATGIR